MKTLKIAHISDLHCDGSEKWTTNFEYVKECLIQEKPHIIVVTGDGVETPSDTLFSSLSMSLSDLYNTVKEKCGNYPLYIVTVPGNHDYKLKGIIKPFWKGPKSCGKLFYKYLSKLQFPVQYKSWEEITNQIYKENQIALFLFDSNKVKKFSYSAQGGIDHPELRFVEQRDRFNELGADLSTCIKIALLHHHPLPLPTTAKGEHEEPFMILRNAYEFLNSAQKHEIDLILHGHKHVSGITEYSCKTHNHSNILVSACGSTSKLSENRREIKIYEIDENQAISGRSYTTGIADPTFTKDKSHSFELIGYSDRRKANSINKDLYIGSENFAIEKSITKTKAVTIQEDGNAVVVIAHEGVQWKTSAYESKMELKECLRADVGRISYGWTKFVEESVVESKESIFWKNPKDEEFERARPSEHEVIYVPAKPNYTLAKDKDAFCEIKYRLFNGYMLTTEDHEESYGPWDGGREETCSIEANYPTEVIELVVKFPDRKVFPARESVYLDAIPHLGMELEKKLTIMRRDYDPHEAETHFLRKKHAIRYRPELNQIVVVIRYPQPNFIYTLRWGLRERDNVANLNNADELVAKHLQDEFLRKMSPKLQTFYQSVCDRFNETFQNEEIEILLLGHNSDKSILEVVQGPERFEEASDICAGRGVAGYAFRTRKVSYWGKTSKFEDSVDSMPCQEPEKIIPGFDPVSVLALPLTYPKISPDKWEEFTEGGNTGRCPVFGVFVLIANQPSEKLDKFCPNPINRRETDETNLRRMEAISWLYSIIWGSIKNHYKEML